MIRAANFFQRKKSDPTIPRNPLLGPPAPGMTHHLWPTKLFVGDKYKKLEDDDDDDNNNNNMNHTEQGSKVDNGNGNKIPQTSAGGHRFIARKKSNEERHLISQEKAFQLMTEYELDENKDLTLNRHAQFGPTPIPSIGACLGAQQIALASVMENESFRLKPKASTDKGKEGKHKRLPLQAKHNLSFTFDRTDTNRLPKKKSRSQLRIEKARATRLRMQGVNPADANVGLEVVAHSPGVHSTLTESTMANTPSPRPTMPGSKLWATQEIHRLC